MRAMRSFWSSSITRSFFATSVSILRTRSHTNERIRSCSDMGGSGVTKRPMSGMPRSSPFPHRPRAKLPEGAHGQSPEVRTEGKRLAARVEHDAAVEPLPGDFTERFEAFQIADTDRCRALHLDAGQAAIIGLEHEIHLHAAMGAEVKELGSRPAPTELFRELTRHERLQERTHRRRLFDEACGRQAGQVPQQPGVGDPYPGRLDGPPR